MGLSISPHPYSRATTKLLPCLQPLDPSHVSPSAVQALGRGHPFGLLGPDWFLETPPHWTEPSLFLCDISSPGL